ncbi:MAG TPA: hypothetical protein VIF62_12275 [Labilithrix sp.]
MKKLLFSTLALLALVACTAGEASPSSGTYTVQFPSTAAAVATDYVQVFAYDFPADQRNFACADLIASRAATSNSAQPIFTGPRVNVCELLNGAKPITVPYGEHAVLAVGLRVNGSATDDFLVGCTIQTFGDGNAPLSIFLELVDLTNLKVPATTCTSIGDRCNSTCKAS